MQKLKRRITFECPTCKVRHETRELAEKCKKTHMVKERVTLYCTCGTGFNVWNWGDEQTTLCAIKSHAERNHDIVIKGAK
jgi:hypothetical protein